MNPNGFDNFKCSSIQVFKYSSIQVSSTSTYLINSLMLKNAEHPAPNPKLSGPMGVQVPTDSTPHFAMAMAIPVL
jgi:hypothetical protein